MSNVVDLITAKAAREGKQQMVWECKCGCQKYVLTEEGAQCFDCGRWWEWSLLLTTMEISASMLGYERGLRDAAKLCRSLAIKCGIGRKGKTADLLAIELHGMADEAAKQVSEAQAQKKEV